MMRARKHLRPISRLRLLGRLLLAGLSWHRGTSLNDEIGGFLTRCFCFRFTVCFVLPPAGTFFFGVRFLTVRFLASDCEFFRDFIVPCMPAWAIDNAFWNSVRMVFIAMRHHARTAHLALAPHDD